jgi:alanine racemase
MDILAIDVTEIPDPAVVRHGNMVTLIGPQISIDELAVACKSTGCEVLSHLGHRFHRIYHVT